MTLYEVDLDKLAVPVESVGSKRKAKEPKEPKAPKEPKEKKPRAPRVKKVKIEEPKEEVQESVSAETLVEEVKVEPKVESKVEEVKEEIEVPTVEVKAKKPRAPRQKKDPAVPPQWFAKYVEGVKKEQATLKPEKVAQKQIKEEAKEAASKSWNNGLTRNRVQNEVDGHSKILLT
tara:strand:- start:1437 stop:1961 length:525 start_codon:yes stop_codon:yes gene_type:complete